MNLLGPILALLVIAAIFMAVVLRIIKNVLIVASPNEVWILSGRGSHQTHDGRTVGYRTVKGGRAIRIPLIEVADRMDLTNMNIELQVKSAYSRGGIPLTVLGVANIKIPGEEPLIHNALERFLGKKREEIMEIARETLEGNLRGVLAALTPEQVNQDKEAFAQRLTEEAHRDLDNLGLVLDNLKIQNVSDDVGYLDSVGRKRSAEVRRNAQIAEAAAKAEAAEAKWRNTMEGELSKLDAQIQVAIKDNQRRIVDAQSRREAMIAEQLGQVQALIAQTHAEIQTQEARLEQVKLQLDADVLQPAEASRLQSEQIAKAQAARIVEQGRATASVLRDLAGAYRDGGVNAKDVLLSQKLVPVMNRVLSGVRTPTVDRLTVLGTGNTGGASFAQNLIATNEQVRAATGLDLAGALSQKLGAPSVPRDASDQVPPPPPGSGRPIR